MSKNFSFYKSNLVKVFIIFFIGFVFRIIINHYFDVNVFLDYTNYISILYYFSLSSFLVYFDQLFSFYLVIPNIDDLNNIRPFNKDLKTTNLFFSNNQNNPISQSSIHHSLYNKVRCKLSWYSLGKDKVTFSSYEEYKLIWDSKTNVWKEVKNFIKWSFHWIDNKPSGIFSQEAIEERTKYHNKYVLDKEAKYKELIKYQESRQQEKEIYARNCTKFGKRR